MTLSAGAGPALHHSFSVARGSVHEGASLAVLAGDLACAQSWELFGRCRWPTDVQQHAHNAFVTMQYEVVLGQQLDLIGDPDVGRMQRLKTGSYTVVGPLRLGGLLAGGDASQLDALACFGEPLGEAFQLRDDVLGTWGDPETTGKPLGTDLKRGKRNAVAAECERMLAGESRREFERVFANASATETQLRRATEALTAAGIRDRLEKRIDTLQEMALRELDQAQFDTAGKRLLQGLAARLTGRDR